MDPAPWIILSSRLPREPSRLRLAVWRRLRRLGAVLLHDALWVLPADARTRESMGWLADEIDEQGGTAYVWEAAGLSPSQDRQLVERFRREAAERYGEIAASAGAIRDAIVRGRRRGTTTTVAHALRQLRGLDRALRLERRRDYFRSPARMEAEAAVAVAIEQLEARRAGPATEAARALGH